MIVTQTFVPVPGLTYFSNAAIYGVKLLQFAREGRVQTEIPTTALDPEPFNDQFTHTGSVITVAGDLPFLPREKITLIWEE